MNFFLQFHTTAVRIAAQMIGSSMFREVILFVAVVVCARIAYVLTSWVSRKEVPEWLLASISDSRVGYWQRFKIAQYLNAFRVIQHINTLLILMKGFHR